MPKQAPARIDLYADVTDRIVAELERGPDAWVKSWTSCVDLWRPLNHATSRPYRGVNVLLVGVACHQRRYITNRWLTFRQALNLGGSVRKGSTGLRVIFWKQVKPQASAASADATDRDSNEERAPVIARHFYVFNVADIDGLPESEHATPTDPTLAARILRQSGAQLVPGEPCYRPAQDVVALPPVESFASLDHYYATAMHELVHWTAPRVGREVQAKRWGDEAYAVEELVAELGAAMLCGVCCIPTLMQSASYLQSWIRVLRQDKRAIFAAASAAQRAADHLLEKAGIADLEFEIEAAAE